MNKTWTYRFNLSILCLLFPFSASATNFWTGPYFGADIGFAKTKYAADNQTVTILGNKVPLSTTTLFPTSSDVTTKNNGWGGRIYAGYSIEQIFGLEAGLVKFPNAVISNVFGINDSTPQPLPSPPFAANTTFKGSKAKVKQLALDVMGKVDIPFLDTFHGFFQAGGAYVQLNHPNTVEVDTTNTAPGVKELSLSVKNVKSYVLRPAFALGVGYVGDGSLTVDLTVYRIVASGQDIGLNFGSKVGNNSANIQSSMLVMLGMGFYVR